MKGVCGPVWVAMVVYVTGVPVPLLVDLREMVVNGGDVVTWRAFEVECDTGAVEVVAVLTEFWARVVPVVDLVNGGAVGVAVPVVLFVSGGGVGVVVSVVVFVNGVAVGVGSVSVTGTCVDVAGVPVGFGVVEVVWDLVGVMTR